MGKELKALALTTVMLVALLMLAVVAGTTGRGQAGIAAKPASAAVGPSGALDGAGESYVVVNTDGAGVFILANPGGEKIKRWPDGTMMTEIGPDREMAGTDWKNVEDPDGNGGWVPERYCFRWLPGSWLVRW